jgi:glycosyl transferase family 2
MTGRGRPRFSVVVPTRDRPDLIEFCLEGLAAQTLEDVEVVVCDNPAEKQARKVFDRWARPGWRYVRPERPLAMHENFERACDEASGEYVAVVIDKTVLHPSALELASSALEHEATDIVTWWNEGYNPIDEARDLRKGLFLPAAATVEPTLYDPAAELARRFSNASRRGLDPIHYVRGKIVFGAYSRTLLDRIRIETGRVFYPTSPDYTSMVPGCVLSRNALDLGRPLLVSYNSARSNGQQSALEPSHARRFIEAAGPTIVDALPIAGLYASPHNIVAYDLVSSAARLPPGSTPELNFVNLVRRVREDLGAVNWRDEAERRAQYALLESEEARLGVTPPPPPPARRTARAAVAELLARAPRIEHLTYLAMGRPSPQRPTTFASPVDAAREADRHYAASSIG